MILEDFNILFKGSCFLLTGPVYHKKTLIAEIPIHLCSILRFQSSQTQFLQPSSVEETRMLAVDAQPANWIHRMLAEYKMDERVDCLLVDFQNACVEVGNRELEHLIKVSRRDALSNATELQLGQWRSSQKHVQVRHNACAK